MICFSTSIHALHAHKRLHLQRSFAGLSSDRFFDDCTKEERLNEWMVDGIPSKTWVRNSEKKKRDGRVRESVWRPLRYAFAAESIILFNCDYDIPTR